MPKGKTTETPEKNTTAETASKAEDTQIAEGTHVRSRKRTSLKEYALTHQIRQAHVAGMTVWLLRNNLGMYHFNKEWDALYEQYLSR